MAVNVNPLSRLLFADLLSIGGIEFWDTLVLDAIQPRARDLVHVVEEGDRIDLLATRYYKEPILWFVIAAVNDLEILPTDLRLNMSLRIPDPDFILSSYFPSSTGGK